MALQRPSVEMAQSSELRIAILMMQKDESTLLPLFLRYHEATFGSSSLYIYDNGSTNQQVIKTLYDAESRGVHVNRDHNTPKGFVNKGEIFTSLIHRLDATAPYDFYFPLDCDEFLACQTETGPSCRRADIDRILSPFREHQATLCISHKYSANPLLRNRYEITTQSRKCFFARGSCGWLDHGFHHGRSRHEADDLSTPIIYFEFHYRTYAVHRRISYAKVKSFHGLMLRRNLKHYIAARTHNHHCAISLLQSKSDYLSQFSVDSHPVVEPCLLSRLAELGADDGSLFERIPARGLRLWLRWLKVRARLNDIWLTLKEGVEIQILALPHVWRGLRRRLRGD